LAPLCADSAAGGGVAVVGAGRVLALPAFICA
jgi:hypothetical protein